MVHYNHVTAVMLLMSAQYWTVQTYNCQYILVLDQHQPTTRPALPVQTPYCQGLAHIIMCVEIVETTA